MDLKQSIKLHQGKKYIELPLENLIKLTLVYMTPLKIEYELEVSQKNPQASSFARQVLDDFWEFVGIKLGLKKGDKVLL